MVEFSFNYPKRPFKKDKNIPFVISIFVIFVLLSFLCQNQVTSHRSTIFMCLEEYFKLQFIIHKKLCVFNHLYFVGISLPFIRQMRAQVWTARRQSRRMCNTRS